MIAVCFITKNEEKWIGGCIDHLRPIVKEFILCDTGSTDRTVEIARDHGAKVSSIEWPGDFATARNISLQQVTQPWVMKIDPDERLDPRDFEKFLKLTEGSDPAYQCWTRAYTNDASRVTTASYQLCRGEYPDREQGYRAFLVYPNIRLFRLAPGVHYVGRIHETVEPTLPGWKNGKSPVGAPKEIYFHHYGHNPEAFAEKGKKHFYEKLIREELNVNPKNWYVLFELANEYFSQQNYEKAVEYFRKADEAHPRKPQVLCNLGYALFLCGNVSEAEQAYRRCLEADADYPDAWLNFGVSRLSAGDFSTALKYFESALQLSPDSFVTLRAKGQCLAQMGRYSESETALRRALALLPHFTEAKVDLGVVLLQTKQTDSSIQLFREALIEAPENQRAQLFLEKALGSV